MQVNHSLHLAGGYRVREAQFPSLPQLPPALFMKCPIPPVSMCLALLPGMAHWAERAAAVLTLPFGSVIIVIISKLGHLCVCCLLVFVISSDNYSSHKINERA